MLHGWPSPCDTADAALCRIAKLYTVNEVAIAGIVTTRFSLVPPT